MINQTTSDAMKIIAELIKGKKIDGNNNERLLNLYEANSEVAANVDELLEFFDCVAYQGNERGIYISPTIDNCYFGFSNDELKRAFSVENNAYLYMCYYIMSTIVTMYFKDDSGIVNKNYVSTLDIVDEVSKRIKILRECIDKDSISKEVLDNEEGCLKLIDIWENGLPNLPNIKITKDISRQKQGKSKIAITNRVLDFMEKQGLVKYMGETDTYYCEERLKTIIYQAYKDSKYLEFLNNIYINFSAVNEMNGGEGTTQK